MSFPIKVVGVDFDQPLEALQVESSYRAVLVVPRVRGSVLGQVLVPASPRLTWQELQSAVERSLGGVLWRSLARLAVERAIRGEPTSPAESAPPTVSVVVDARGGAACLTSCLDSISALRTPPTEVLVLDRCGEDAVKRLCIESGVGYLQQPSRPVEPGPGEAVLAARGELVAFVDGACEVDPGWLDGLERSFRDPLAMVVAGYVGPAELETAAQCAFEGCRGVERSLESRTIGGASDEVDFASASPARGAYGAGSGVNAIVRRRFLLEAELGFGGGSGLPSPSLGELWTFYRILAGGYRVVFDPARVVWLRYPRTPDLAATATRDAAAAASAFAIRCALKDREPGAARLAARLALGSNPRGSLGASIRSSSAGRVPGKGRMRLRRISGALGGLRLARRPMSGAPETPSMESLYPEPRAGGMPAGSGSAKIVSGPYPELAVLVPSFERREKLLRLLRALRGQTYDSDRFEVTVAIDGSGDGSAEAARSLDAPYPLKVAEQDHRGVAAARNQAASQSRAPVLVYLDDDMIPEARLLEEHARAHRNGDKALVAIGYCPTTAARNGLWEHMLRSWWEDHYARMAEEDHQWTWIDFSVGNSSFSRSLFESCGGFDEAFRRRNEDQELGVRLAEAGANFAYQPAARAWHHFETKFAASLGDARRQGLYDMLLIQKHPRLRRRVSLQAWFQADGSMKSKPALAYRFSSVGRWLLPPAVRAAALLERLRMRRAWYALTGELRATAYLLGMKKAVQSGAEAGVPMGPGQLGEEAEVLHARLGEEGTLAVSPRGLEPELELSLRGEELLRLPAMRLGAVWRWDDLIERATEQCVEPLRARLDLEQLQRLATPDLEPSRARRPDD